MLKFITTLTLFLFGILANAQVTETRTITDFNQLEVKNAKVIYTQSNLSSLKIESEYNDTPETILTEITNGKLSIKGINAGEKTIVYVSGKAASFQLGSNAELHATNLITAQSAAITLGSGARFNGSLKTQHTAIKAGKNCRFKGAVDTRSLRANLNSNAQAIICGLAQDATISAKGNTLCSARNLLAGSIQVNANGNSKVTVYSDRQIAIDVLDNAQVIYKGLPKKVSLNANAMAISHHKSEQVVTYNY